MLPNLDEMVWKIVLQVPSGKVTTYGQIASMLPCPPDQQRLLPQEVGQSMNRVSGVENMAIPWWRVINAKGAISLPAGSAVALRQLSLLQQEGVVFDSKGQTNFALFAWAGPSAEWLAETGFLAPIPLYTPPDETQLSLF